MMKSGSVATAGTCCCSNVKKIFLCLMDSHRMINWTTVSRQVFSTNAPVLYALCYLALSKLLLKSSWPLKLPLTIFACVTRIENVCGCQELVLEAVYSPRWLTADSSLLSGQHQNFADVNDNEVTSSGK